MTAGEISTGGSKPAEVANKEGGPATSAGALLEEAAQVWVASRAQYRDAMIRVGGLLHRYVLARLGEGAGRAAVTAEAAARLGVRVCHVNGLIAGAKTAELLGGGYPLGRLSWGSVLEFRPAVQRDQGGGRGSESDPRRESWSVAIPEAPRLFRQACEEGWVHSRVRRAVREVFGGPAPRDARAGPGLVPPDLRALARAGTPRDLAQAMREMVLQSPDPFAVLGAFQDGLPELERLARRARLAAG